MPLDEAPVGFAPRQSSRLSRAPPAHRAPCASENAFARKVEPNARLHHAREDQIARSGPSQLLRLHLCEDRRMAIASRGPRFADGQSLRRFGRNFEGPGAHSGRKLKTLGTNLAGGVSEISQTPLCALPKRLGASRRASWRRQPSQHHLLSWPRPTAPAPTIGGLFMTTKADRSRWSTRRSATIADMSSSALWTRLRPLTRSANP